MCVLQEHYYTRPVMKMLLNLHRAVAAFHDKNPA